MQHKGRYENSNSIEWGRYPNVDTDSIYLSRAGILWLQECGKTRRCG